MKTALEFLAAVKFVRSGWLGSRRLWVVPVAHYRHEVRLLALAALVVLQMRRWLGVSSLVLLAPVVPQMRHCELASPVLVQAGRQ